MAIQTHDATRIGPSYSRRREFTWLGSPSDAWAACWAALGKGDDAEACSLMNKMIRHGREGDVTTNPNRFGNLLQHQVLSSSLVLLVLIPACSKQACF